MQTCPISHIRDLHVPHILSISGISSRSKTLFVKMFHTLLHINVKLLHIKIMIYHSKIFLCISLSATLRDITVSTCTTHFEHVVTDKNIISQNASHLGTHKCEVCRLPAVSCKEPTMSTPFGHDQQPAPNAVW